MYAVPFKPTTEAILTIEPFPASIILGIKIFKDKKTASRFALKFVLHALKSISLIRPEWIEGALFTRPSILPKES